MLDRVSQLAEEAATNVSRRSFLRALGRVAMVTAATLGGLLAVPASALADPRFCSVNSESQCNGVPVGTACVGFDGRKGKCSDAGRPKGSCLCRTSRVKDPRVD